MKPNKTKYSKAGKEQHQGKVVSTKRAITKPPSKEKSVLNSVRSDSSEVLNPVMYASEPPPHQTSPLSFPPLLPYLISLGKWSYLLLA